MCWRYTIKGTDYRTLPSPANDNKASYMLLQQIYKSQTCFSKFAFQYDFNDAEHPCAITLRADTSLRI